MSYFRRHVNLNDTNLQDGDYCSVSLCGSNDRTSESIAFDGIMVVVGNNIFLLSNERDFKGTSVLDAVRAEAGMQYSWIMGNIYDDLSMRYALQNCGDAHFTDITQRTRQVNLTTTHLQDGDYCPVSFTCPDIEGDNDGVLVMHYNDIFLLNNSSTLDGATCHLQAMELRGYSFSWSLRSYLGGDDCMNDIQTNTRFRFTQNSNDVSVIDRTQPTPQPQSDTPSELMSDKYQKDIVFEGMHSYHAHHGHEVNLPLKRYTHRIGVELEVEFGSSSKRVTFTDIKTNWFYCERDGSLGSNGCEIITIPLHPNDAKSPEFWKPLCDTLTSLDAKSWDTSTCGCHVHIGREILGKDDDEKSQTLGKLLYFYHEYLKDALGNCKIYGRTHGYHDTICKTDISTAVKTLGSSVLKDKEVRERLDKSMKDRSQATRYFDINVMNSATIEFRKGRGSLNPERIAMIVEWSELIVSYAKFTHWKNISMETFKTFIKMKSGLSPMTMKHIEDYFA